jgi:hypothetical protein
VHVDVHSLFARPQDIDGVCRPTHTHRALREVRTKVTGNGTADDSLWTLRGGEHFTSVASHCELAASKTQIEGTSS